MELNHWSARSTTRGGDWVKGGEGVNRILASCVFPFIRKHENLVQVPSINKSVKEVKLKLFH